jgi:hypothetical protein
LFEGDVARFTISGFKSAFGEAMIFATKSTLRSMRRTGGEMDCF